MKKFAALVIIAFFTQSVFATIRYTDVYDFLYDDPRYDIDLDGDDDFMLRYHGSGYYYLDCLKPTSYFAADTDINQDPKAYTHGAGMGTYQWVSETGTLVSDLGANFNNTDKYLMVKFNSGSNTYYGWIFIVYYDEVNEYYVDGFAYQDEPGVMLKAGDRQTTPPTGIQPIDPSVFTLSVLNRHQIAFRNCTDFDRVNIISMDGKTLTEISAPVALQQYNMLNSAGIVLVAFYKEDKLLFSRKYFVQ